MKQIFLAVFLALGVAAFAHADNSAVPTSAPMWEYLVVPFDQPDAKKLNELGQQKWELVSVNFNLTNGHTESSGTYFLKRPLDLVPVRRALAP